MNREEIQVSGYTIIGDRASQQDLFMYEWNNDVLLAVVCDGMGGMAGGEMASKIAVNSIFQSFQEIGDYDEVDLPCWMEKSFEKADQMVHSLADVNGNPLKAGTTVVAVMILDRQMYWGCVGDSRIYYLREGQIIKITRMHNYNMRLEEMFLNGEITASEREKESQRGDALISFLGIGGLPVVDISPQKYPMEKGDVIILCSDGLYKSLDDQQIQAIVEESGEKAGIASKRLCDEALRLAEAKQDNTTVIVIRCG